MGIFYFTLREHPAAAGEPATLRLIRRLPDSTIEQNLSYVLPAFMRL